MNILMLYPKFPEHTQWNVSDSARLFMHRRGNVPPLGLLAVASYLPKDFEVRLVDRNISTESAADWEWADVVFLSLMLAQRQDYNVCVTTAKKYGKPIAVGGPFTHGYPEVAAAADWVCFGEAEDIMEEFVNDLRLDRRGRQYQGGNKTDMERVKVPRFDLLPNGNDYTGMAIQFSRGCPFRCEFCDVIELYGRIPRTKRPEQILAELTAIKKLGFRGYVILIDENFIGNKRKAKVMLTALADWNRENGYPYRYYTEATINLADDVELLEAMSRANFVIVFVGIETPDVKLLKTTQKTQNIPGNLLQKVQKLREYGIHVTAGFIVGFDGESRGIFAVQRSFIQDSGIGIAMPGLLVALPHTQLSDRLKRENRLLEQETVLGISTLEGINFVPKSEMTKREYLKAFAQLLTEVYEPKAYFERILPALLSLHSTASIRGLLQVSRDGLPIILRILFHLGIKNPGARGLVWKTFFQLLFRNPKALETFAWDCFYFYHLNRHAHYVEREMSRYLVSPSPGDVLDEVVLPDAIASPIPVSIKPRALAVSSNVLS